MPNITMKVLVVFAALLVAKSHGLFFGRGPAWNSLQVTWGLNPLSSQNFAHMPRTENEAKAAGWTKKSECTGENQQFFGKRYVLDGDTAVMLLYGKNGYIAGIQVGIPKNLGYYPYDGMKYRAMWRDEADMHSMTAYMVDPAKICTTGRTSDEFESQGTGTGLWIQNGADPLKDRMVIPMTYDGVKKTGWTEQKCFWSMGLHFWYAMTGLEMSKDDFLPAFLLYNDGKLNAFGWSFPGNLPSKRYEHPTPDVLNKFWHVPPKEMVSEGATVGFTTLHIYFSEYPQVKNRC